MKDSAYITLDAIAEHVIKSLSGKVIIHRYDAYSTNSIYLKFDYGIANSLRISDHRGKAHLAYRFNIGLDVKEPYTQTQDGNPREYFPPRMIDRVIAAILANKEDRKNRYRDYEALVKQAKEKAKHEIGFWQQAKEIQYPTSKE